MILKSVKTQKMGTNCYITGDDVTKEVMVIDPGGDQKKITDIIKKEGYKVKYIFLTHGHWDHIACVGDIKKLTGAKVVVHQKDADCLWDVNRNLAYLMGEEGEKIEADITVVDNDCIKVGSHIYRVIHTPGHTPGSVCLYVEGKLFSGDTIFAGTFGTTDFYGGDYEQIIDSIITKVLVLPEETKIYPGHGRNTTVGEERKYYMVRHN